MATAPKKLNIIAIVCERSVNFDKKLNEQNQIKECPNVTVIKVPCSGQIQPSMIEAPLKAGADGVITTGCRIGDCYYREGNKFLRERLLGERQPKLRATVDRKRLQAYWLSALEFGQFTQMASSFSAYLETYEPATTG
ncbi:MAG: hydrogenase iron-sulfur subunit [Cyanobacteria bacterium HKST-UBA06]|nr:hydrogenase iron-sulfur subunit [Cyanobacteria bacterium HKST-UBA06]